MAVPWRIGAFPHIAVPSRLELSADPLLFGYGYGLQF